MVVIPNSEQAFVCPRCGRREIQPFGVLWPSCHGMRMGLEEEIIRNRDPNELDFMFVQIDPMLYDPFRASEGVFVVPAHWMKAWEVWYLGGKGRPMGERFGWVGQIELGYAYQAVPGVRSLVASGVAPTRVEAFSKLWDAIREG